MSKESILKATVDLYAHYGIRGVSMNQIAGALQISKKTLYEEFGNKEDLLCACIDHEIDRISKLLDKTEKETHNPVETIVMLTSVLFQYQAYYCPAFYRDLNKFRQANSKIENCFYQLGNKYAGHFQEGMEQGFFQPEFDYETMSNIFLQQLQERNSSHQTILIFTFLRGICTEKGLEVLSHFSPSTIRKSIYDYN